MNKNRRKEIKIVISGMEVIKNKLTSILNDESNYFDNMPENLQSSMRGCDSEEAIEYLEEACDLLDEIVEKLENI